MRIGVDIGGTFTDLIVISNNTIIKRLKVVSTPANPAIGVLNAIRKLNIDLSKVRVIVHGSTIATNTILEGKGAKTALITTKGFRDILEIQREDRDNIYDLFYQKPTPSISRDRIYEVQERIDARGKIIKPLHQDEVRKLARCLSTKKIESIAISLLHSYMNSRHEEIIEEAVRESMPDSHISRSSTISPEFREYERTSTVVINACVSPKMDGYIAHLEQELRSSGFEGDLYIMQSNGGVLPSTLACEHGARTLLSGPAAGVIGAVHVAKRAGIKNLISLDMGGTSTDVCLVTAEEPRVTTDKKIGGLPVKLPMIDIETVAAGGGSVAWIDPGGMLRVGPESAGADPGPACYGKSGTQPTVTDAHVVLGSIREGKFAGGIKLDKVAAAGALENLAKTLNKNYLETAEAILAIANNNMAQATRLVSVERGYDPRSYVIVAFGGAGPLHAAYLAEELGVKRVLIPPSPGLLSAYGLLVADFKRDYVQSRISLVSKTDVSGILKVLQNLRDKATEEIQTYDVSIEECLFTFSIDMRYYGQAFEINIPVSLGDISEHGTNQIKHSFHKTYHSRYGYSSPDEEILLVNYRLTVSYTQAPSRTKEEQKVPPSKSIAKFETSYIFLGGDKQEFLFVERENLFPGSKLDGPAIIEDLTATTFVPPKWRASKDEFGNIKLERGEK